MNTHINISVTEPEGGYALIDSGDGEKLERFGDIVLRRPDPQALWSKRFPVDEWKKADGSFKRTEAAGEWALNTGSPKSWDISFAGLTMRIRPTAFKHTGLFPEHKPNWQWLRDAIGTAHKPGEIEILNLFGYTGGATLACAQAGAKVVHIDSSKSAVAWARENAELSGLADKPIRWIVEDARVFVEREIKRGRKYDGIIMDPPAFGHGPTSKLWKIEDDFLPLIDQCIKLLKPEPLLFLVNGYSAGYSAVAYGNNLKALVGSYGGTVEIGELTVREDASLVRLDDGAVIEPRLLPAGIYARWKK